jgi:predicted deacetylase
MQFSNGETIASGQPGRERLLLTAIHDVGPRFERDIDRLAELFEHRLGGPRFAMLVVPDHWGSAPLAVDLAFQAKLRGWADRGIEIFVHGWFHRDSTQHAGFSRLKARHLTAGEGEFLGLSYGEAVQRMADGRALIEGITGRAVAGFIAPAWLYGDGARLALRGSGFALAEDHWRVWQPDTGKTLARGPVITWASRSRARQLSSLAVAALGRNLLGAQRVVRMAAHPGDTAVPQLMTSIDATLKALTGTRRPAAYADLLGKSHPSIGRNVP